jgi:adenosylcobinamide-phosphate synthase
MGLLEGLHSGPNWQQAMIIGRRAAVPDSCTVRPGGTSIDTIVGLLDGPARILLLAIGIELVVSDPVSRWHPVAVFGRAISGFIERAPSSAPARELLYGLAVVGAAVVLVGVGSAVLLHGLTFMSPALAVFGGAVLLKISFSYRQLEREVSRVAELLERDGVAAARAPLSALVSRDVIGLSPRLAASAAIESMAENLSDSFVAPLFYYVIFGVPGALAYRAINTLDAMIGYHGRYQHLGRAAAKLDDLANVVPARLTAALLVIAARLAGADLRGSLAMGLRDHARTESPNAGWPMAAMAGALRVELEKVGHYVLGRPADDPTPEAIRRAIPIARWGAVMACLLTLLTSIGSGW